MKSKTVSLYLSDKTISMLETVLSDACAHHIISGNPWKSYSSKSDLVNDILLSYMYNEMGDFYDFDVNKI